MRIPWGLLDYRAALPALAMVLVPALLMVSTIRFRSFKTIDLHVRRSYTILIVIAAALVLITTHPAVRARGDGVRLPRVAVRGNGLQPAATPKIHLIIWSFSHSVIWFVRMLIDSMDQR